MATAAAVERFKAQGKQQLNCWIDSDVATVLKALSVQRSQSYGDTLRDALIALHSGQPVAPVAPATGGGDSLDRLSMSVTGLHEDIASLRSIIGDLQDDLEARLSAVEATINAVPVLPIPSNNSAPETPVRAAPGAKKTPVKRVYKRASDDERDKRDNLIIELHHKGLTPTKISRELPKCGFHIGVGISNVREYIKEQRLTPHTDRRKSAVSRLVRDTRL